MSFHRTKCCCGLTCFNQECPSSNREPLSCYENNDTCLCNRETSTTCPCCKEYSFSFPLKIIPYSNCNPITNECEVTQAGIYQCSGNCGPNINNWFTDCTTPTKVIDFPILNTQTINMTFDVASYPEDNYLPIVVNSYCCWPTPDAPCNATYPWPYTAVDGDCLPSVAVPSRTLSATERAALEMSGFDAQYYEQSPTIYCWPDWQKKLIIDGSFVCGNIVLDISYSILTRFSHATSFMTPPYPCFSESGDLPVLYGFNINLKLTYKKKQNTGICLFDGEYELYDIFLGDIYYGDYLGYRKHMFVKNCGPDCCPYIPTSTGTGPGAYPCIHCSGYDEAVRVAELILEQMRLDNSFPETITVV